jgi:hypothetical protein
MTVRRINFLKRKKIAGNKINIQLSVVGATKRFSISADLAEYSFPAGASIFVDVTQSSMEAIRFLFGTVGSPAFREEDISRLAGESVVFNLYVVDSATAQKLGVAEAIRIKSQDGKFGGSNSLLPVDGTKELSGILWRVDFDIPGAEGASDAPVLRIDKHASLNSASEFLNNPVHSALILPAAMRLILAKILLECDAFEYDSTSTSWRHAWVRFAITQTGDALPEAEHSADLPEWIDQACAAFSRRSQLHDGFLKHIEK